MLGMLPPIVPPRPGSSPEVMAAYEQAELKRLSQMNAAATTVLVAFGLSFVATIGILAFALTR